jgi:predicted phage tail protein
MPNENHNDAQQSGKIAREMNEEVDEQVETATTAVQTLGAGAIDAKRDIATTAVQTLGADAVDAKKEIAMTVLQTLSAEQRADIVAQVSGPTQQVRDRLA